MLFIFKFFFFYTVYKAFHTIFLIFGIAKNAPIAVAQSKKAINNGLQLDIDGGVAEEVKDFAECFNTEDQKYGMECFVNHC